MLFEGDEEMTQRLAELRALAPGWYDGSYGSQVTQAAIEKAAEIWRAVVAAGGPRLQIFPTTEGGINLEWWGQDGNRIAGDIKIGPDGEVVSAGSTNVDTHQHFDPPSYLTEDLARWVMSV